MEHLKRRHTAIQDIKSTEQGEEPRGSSEGLYEIHSFFENKTVLITARGMLEIAAYVERNRAKIQQEAVKSAILSPTERYYIQRVTETMYYVKERREMGQNRTDDSVVKAFEGKGLQAYAFTKQLNELQTQFDIRYGHWTKQAAFSETISHPPLTQASQVLPLPDLRPFEFRWYSCGLGAYRFCGQTYCGVAYEDLPPLPQTLFQGTLDWLLSLGDNPNWRGMDHYHSEADLQHIITIAQQLSIPLPEAFLRWMGSPELLERIPSPTDCYVDLSTAIVIRIGDETGYVIRFITDRQGVLSWFLYLTAEGKQWILVGEPWLDDIDTSVETENTQEGQTRGQNKRRIEEILKVCAFSFEAFLYRFWLENILWYKLMSDKVQQALTEEEEHYLQYYRPVNQ